MGGCQRLGNYTPSKGLKITERKKGVSPDRSEFTPCERSPTFVLLWLPLQREVPRTLLLQRPGCYHPLTSPFVLRELPLPISPAPREGAILPDTSLHLRPPFWHGHKPTNHAIL